MIYLMKIALRDGINPMYLQKVARRARYSYKHYTIPKATGGRRNIFQPSRELKTIQRWLVRNFLSSFPVHPSATAYGKSCSIKKNAARHKNNNFLLRMDFENFFESLTVNDLTSKIFSQGDTFNPPLDKQDIEIIEQLLFRGGIMTIGAPSSPVLSNILMFDFDRELTQYCNANNVIFTRYADDLFFSTRKRNILSNIEGYVLKLTQEIKLPSHIAINANKTRHTSKKGRRSVTGIIITDNAEISIGRSKKREIRSIVHRFICNELEGKQIEKLKLSLFKV